MEGVVRADGSRPMVPTDQLVKAASRVQYMSVWATPPLKFRASVHRQFGQSTKGQTSADTWLPVSESV